MAHIQSVEKIVSEFLVWKGFTNTLRSFENETRNDRTKHFRVDLILNSIQLAIATHDLNELREIWKTIETFFFTKLEQNYTDTLRKLESGLFKVYLVTAYKSGQTDKIGEFFSKMAAEIHSQAEWRDFFYFQYCKQPEENPTFAIYFTKQYQDTLYLSLHNLLATIFQSIPLPAILKTESEAHQIKKLQEENAKLKQRLSMSATSSGAGSAHQSRQQMFTDKKRSTVTSPNEISPFDVDPPAHVVDDFFIIACQESLNLSDNQSKGFKSLIRNISSGTSPVMGRKEAAHGSDKPSKRSGSVGSQRTSWLNRD